MLKWKVGDVVLYRPIEAYVWPNEPKTILKVLRCKWFDGHPDLAENRECVECNKLRIVLSKSSDRGGNIVGCGGNLHCRLVRRTSRTYKETTTNLRLPHLKEYLEVIGK